MLRKLLKNKEKGFTIIEVMIVLAIAGLILVVVLVAIPQLQRNQRDTARQNVTSRLSTELGTYATNNGGSYPFATGTGAGTLSDFNTRYVQNGTNVILELRNPQSGNQYTVTQATATNSNPTADQLMVYPGMQCNGEAVTGTISTSSRQFAIKVLLERANTYFCADNS